jgi:predicted metal-dependent phosphoesterase TrpH
MRYLFETHAHTAESSPCSNVAAGDLVKAYKDNGYSGIIITDHVGDWGFSEMRGTWKDKAGMVIRAYEKAKDAGEKEGLKILFGLEIALNHPYRDFLIYGVGYDFLYKNENIQDIALCELYKLVHAEDALLIAAHPFRGLREMPDPKHLDGAEVVNSNPRNTNHNEKALEWAEQHNMIRTAGSDFHEYEDILSGMWLNRCPEDIKGFVKILKSGEYELKY